MGKITIISLAVLLSLFFSCATNKKVALTDNIEQWVSKAQEYTDRGRYIKAIEILNQALEKYPDTETIAVNYNIGFNYYKLLKKEEAKKYFNKIINIFENSNFDERSINENRKFIILAGLMLERMVNEVEERKDPYHVKEDLEKYEKIRPKKKNMPKIIK